MTEYIRSQLTASITELKTNPMKVVNSEDGEPIAILNYNKPAFYCVPVDTYDALLEHLEDLELLLLYNERKNEEGREVILDDL